jgi:hypothetical protein
MHQDSSVPKTPASASVGGATPATAARGDGGQQQPPLPPPRVAKPREGAHGEQRTVQGETESELVGSRTDTVARGKRGSSGWMDLYSKSGEFM